MLRQWNSKPKRRWRLATCVARETDGTLLKGKQAATMLHRRIMLRDTNGEDLTMNDPDCALLIQWKYLLDVAQQTEFTKVVDKLVQKTVVAVGILGYEPPKPETALPLQNGRAEEGKTPGGKRRRFQRHGTFLDDDDPRSVEKTKRDVLFRAESGLLEAMQI